MPRGREAQGDGAVRSEAAQRGQLLGCESHCFQAVEESSAATLDDGLRELKLVDVGVVNIGWIHKVARSVEYGSPCLESGI